MNDLISISAFDSQRPLLFTQWEFWVFFAAVYILFTLIMEIGKDHRSRVRLHLRNVFLMLASWFFYYKTSGTFLLLLLFLTLSNWLFARAVHAADDKKWLKCLCLWVCVLVDIGLLGFFKYAYFGADFVNQLFGTHLTITEKILLPVGISFYTFQVVSYIADVYHRRIEPVSNLLDFAFYVSFFPQLVAGPIVRASEFVPQLYRPYQLSRRQFGIAVFWILNGLVKKIVLSDFLAVSFIDRVFENPMLFTGAENLLALFAYSLQVYADFSGYTDIAIGVAMLMGFFLPQNFHSPYKARNPQEFWRRWHMSLSRWLKTYVYIPLGGNRSASVGTYVWIAVIAVVALVLSGSWWVTGITLGIALIVTIVAWLRPQHRPLLAANLNSFITMLLGGLWHGASWNFLIWGGLNGIGMIVNKIWRRWNVHFRFLSVLLIAAGITAWRYFYPQPWLNVVWVAAVVVAAGSLLGYLYYLCRLPDNSFAHAMQTIWAVLQTFVFITFTRLFFRAGSNLDPATANETAWRTAREMMQQIGSAWNADTILPVLWTQRLTILLFMLGMLIHWMPDKFKLWYRVRFASLPVWLILLIVIAVVTLLYRFMLTDVQPFIYFQF